jgi:prepilin-type N-terminal cleavage/methylation domain-containing protein
MATIRHRNRRRGFTLVEALTTATVLGILSVGVSALYMASLRLYTRGQRESTSRDKASLALERMMSELREAYNVDYPGPSLIVFTMPQKGIDGRYVLDPLSKTLLTGKQVMFYQAGANGAMGTTGRYIWRAERAAGTSTWTKRTLIMDDVEDLSFTYAPSIDMLELVQVAITVGQGEDPGYFNRTEVAEVWIRNH